MMKAFILCYYGGLESIDGLTDFYTSVFGNRTPPNDYLHKAKQRFVEHGRSDPMYTVAKRQQQALQMLIDKEQRHTKVYVAFKHSAPQIDSVVREAMADGATAYDIFPMTPFHSRGGGEYYANRVRKSLKANDLSDQPVNLLTGWYDEPTFVKLMTERVKEAITWLPKDVQINSALLFSVHSQPGTEEHNASFIKQYEQLSQEIAAAVGMSEYVCSYRSAGPPPQVWLGPDNKEVAEELIKTGKQGIIAIELLSVTENIEAITEVQQDIQDICHEHNVSFVTIDFLNDQFKFMHMLYNWYIKQI